MQLIDAHIHLASPRYPDVAGLVARAQAAGIAGVVAAAVDETSSRHILAMQQAFPAFVRGGLGVHPERHVTDEETERVLALIRQERPRLTAIAEVGLPWYTVRERPDRERLIAAGEPRLRRFLQLARELDLAVVLHAPHAAAERALALLEAEGIERALFHWHKAAPEVTRAIVEGGYCVSVTPETCYRERDRELVAAVPLTNLLLETDGPWPYGGEFEGHPTEPTFLRRLVEEVAAIKGLAVAEVAEIIAHNAARLFQLNDGLLPLSLRERAGCGKLRGSKAAWECGRASEGRSVAKVDCG
ncbi:MAG: TatD family hydrolase [Nitrospinae bacterium]|nr:TatD family hydrolase [Nitrospinota bacterium]